MPLLNDYAEPGHELDDFSSPLSDIGKGARHDRYSAASLGVVMSEVTRQTMSHVRDTRNGIKSFGLLTNRGALADLDPHYVTTGLNQVLESRFKRVVALTHAKEAATHDIDLVMSLDLNIRLGTNSGATTTVTVAGRFVDGDGRAVDTVSGNGTGVVPYPAFTFQFKHAAKAALEAFVRNLDASTKLAAAAGRSSAASTALVTAPVEPAPPAITSGADGKLAFGAYHALVIGINAYQSLPKLQTAVNDARSVAQVLGRDYGFQVRLLLNASRAHILTAIGKLRQELTPRDNLLIYYAGHGWMDRAADEGYWLPADATRDSQVNWVSNATITSALKAIQAKHVLIVADSCYSGKLTRAVHISKRDSGYLARIANKRARVVLSSGGLEPVADSGPDASHSVFTAAFLQALQDNQGVMDATALFTHIRRPVMLNADQTPEYADIRKAGHEGGDFLFVRKTASR